MVEALLVYDSHSGLKERQKTVQLQGKRDSKQDTDDVGMVYSGRERST